ncbi:MAG: phosphoribosylamine--glycine ligase, partial [SAR86 cluster bacterium]
REAAQLEGSKEFMKDFLCRHEIPTAVYQSFSDLELAMKYLKGSTVPIVIKADGLAAGKGVTVAQSYSEAEKAIRECLEEKSFGEAGNKVVIEEFLEGEEASFIVLTDGKTVLPLASSQDHKTRDNQDQGPNTGGMGAYSPAPVVTAEIHERIMGQVIIPTIEGLAKEGISYCGFLYAGLMIDAEQNIKVLEFNCRFGDPETQPILMRFESDLVELCYQASKGELEQIELQWNPKVAVGVVMAAGGYPYNYEKGHPIEGLPPETENLKVFHAGTQAQNNVIKTDGGRVLCVTALGKNTTEAQLNAYNCVEEVSWKDCFYRTDIGYRAIERES